MSFTPLRTVPFELIQRVASSPDYRASAELLLEQVCRLDNLLSVAIVVELVPEGEDYIFDPKKYDRERGVRLFREIRQEADRIQTVLPLLADAAEWPNHISHMTTNILCALEPKRRRMIASVDTLPERVVTYQNVEAMNYEGALATYMGLSPMPVFGFNIDYAKPEVVNFLSPFGFGVFVYLHLTLNPDTVKEGVLPHEIDHQGIFSRPVASLPILREPDGSLTLASRT